MLTLRATRRGQICGQCLQALRKHRAYHNIAQEALSRQGGQKRPQMCEAIVGFLLPWKHFVPGPLGGNFCLYTCACICARFCVCACACPCACACACACPLRLRLRLPLRLLMRLLLPLRRATALASAFAFAPAHAPSPARTWKGSRPYFG